VCSFERLCAHGDRFYGIGLILAAGIKASLTLLAFCVLLQYVLTSTHARSLECARTQTMDGTIYFRAATRVSPRNYKSFTARKFLQVKLLSVLLFYACGFGYSSFLFVTNSSHLCAPWLMRSVIFLVCAC